VDAEGIELQTGRVQIGHRGLSNTASGLRRAVAHFRLARGPNGASYRGEAGGEKARFAVGAPLAWWRLGYWPARCRVRRPTLRLLAWWMRGAGLGWGGAEDEDAGRLPTLGCGMPVAAVMIELGIARRRCWRRCRARRLRARDDVSADVDAVHRCVGGGEEGGTRGEVVLNASFPEGAMRTNGLRCADGGRGGVGGVGAFELRVHARECVVVDGVQA